MTSYLSVNRLVREVTAMAGCWQWCRSTCVCFLSEEEKKTIAVDKEIKRILKQQKKKERREIKVLLLGQYPPHRAATQTAGDKRKKKSTGH